MKNILMLDTSIGSLNQGDEIINLSIKKNWEQLYSQNYIMYLATHTPMYTLMQSTIYKKKLHVFKDADYKFLCGTNALYTNMLRPLPSWNINILDYGLARGTICIGAGIGINSKKVNYYTRKLYDKVLNHDYVHSVRDKKTEDFLKNLGFKAINTGCPTLWGLTPELCSSISQKKGKKVIFTLTYYEKDNINDKKMIEVLRRNYEKIYFWPQCIKDLEYLKELNEDKDINIVPPNVTEYEKILNLPDMDYVGNRLHGGIYALQHRCRTIIISIDYRAQEMSNNYSFECIQREQISLQLENKINSTWNTNIKGIDFKKIKEWKDQFGV